MKFNPIEKIRQTLRRTSVSSRVLFVLTVVSGALWIYANLEEEFFLLTGLMGVLWLSSIALHHARSRSGNEKNPFSILLVASAVLFILTLVLSKSIGKNYNEQNEPLNVFTSDLGRMLDESGADLMDKHAGLLTSMAEHAMNGVQYNLIVTNAQDEVVYALNSWRASAEGTLRPLIRDSNGYTLLVDAKGAVLGTGRADKQHLDARFLPAQNSLTRGGTETDKTEADRLYERYFPSFGRAIDYYIGYLPTVDLLVSADGPLDSVHISEGNNAAVGVDYNYVSFLSWDGTTLVGCDFNADHSGPSMAELVSELNALTDEQRDALKEYAIWFLELSDSMTSRRNGQFYPVYIRMLRSADGSANAYLIYELEREALYPLHQAHLERELASFFYSSFALWLIPAAIVFLAFWVFVDAKQRGQARPALWAVLTLIGNVIAWIIYMLVRPQMMKTAAGQPMPKGACPICGTKLKSDFIACPGCGILLRNRCKNCGKALENDWSFCPYCTTAVTKELPEPSEAEA